MTMQQAEPNAFTRALAVVAAGLMITAGFAGVVAAGPTSGGQLSENVTAVTSCETLDRPGKYIVQQDITDTPADGCFEVTADNVVIIGGGHTVAGANGTGTAITATGVKDLTVRNLHLSDWGTGVALESTTDSELTNLTITDSAVVGVSIEGETRSVTIQDSSVDEGTVGIRAGSESRHVTVADSEFANLTGTGVDVRGTDTELTNNTIRETGATGVRLSNAENVTVAENRFVRTIGGVTASDTGGAKLRKNTFSEVEGTSIHVTDEESAIENLTAVSQRSRQANLFGALGGSYWAVPDTGVAFPDASEAEPPRVINNTVSDGAGHGILVETDGAWVAENTVRWNNDGIHIGNATNVSVINNSATENRDDGVHYAASSDGLVRGNEFTNNDDDGLYVVGDGATVTDNVATANGDDGVDIQNSTVRRVSRNRLENNGEDGLYFREVVTGNVTANVIRSNTDDGIDLRGTRNVTVVNNTVCENTHRQVIVRRMSTDNQLEDNGC